MAKPKLVLRAPLLTASGYGVHSRQIFRALMASDAFDVSTIPIKWGETPYLFDQNDTLLRSIRQLAGKYEQEQRAGVKYDVSVQVTIPNEFEKLARVNVGVTAGIEVDRVSPEWIIKANEKVDLVVVPSEHSLHTYKNVRYQAPDGQALFLKKPSFVAPEGVDTTIFNTDPVPEEVSSRLKLEPDFNFLCVGLGFDRGLGEDRKNLSSLVKWFCERFKDDKTVGLVLKVGLVNNSLVDFETTRRRISELKALAGCTGPYPRVYLVHGRLSDSELAALYKHPKIKAFITLTHGEGFGLPIIEAAACGLPVVATNWSGHLDFLKIDDKNKFVPLDYSMTQIPKSVVWKGVMEEGTQWASVKEEDVKLKMKKLVLSYDKPKEWATELAGHIKENFSLEKVSYTFVTTLIQFLNDHGNSHPQTEEQFITGLKNKFSPNGEPTLLYTMPMSAGDVLVSTGVVSSLKKKFPAHKIIFATDQKYSDLLSGNPDIDQVIQFEEWMMNVPICDRVFDEVYTPNLAIQTIHANWVRGGKGRRLAEEMAFQCSVDLGDYRVARSEFTAGLPENFIAFHPGAGKGQWEARNYIHWQEIVENLGRISGLPVVQIGNSDEPEYKGTVDLRGKTSYSTLADVIGKAKCLVGIDSVTMHMAAVLGTPHVALFGSSYANSTGPARPKGLSVLLETPSRYSCDKACYKYQCSVDKEHPCINEIAPKNVVSQAITILGQPVEDMTAYKEYKPKISGYTHLLNPDEQGMPYLESIGSMLGFCDEVVVVDGGSTDGTLKKIAALGDDRVKVIERKWDWEEPGMDGMQKAYGRAMCTGDFLWQQDADELVHEDDYGKIREIIKRFPKDLNLLHLPVIELWGDSQTVRTDRHSWKWRLSRNDFRLTHGINKDARVVDKTTGKTFAKKGQSDGCEYVDIMTGEFIQHAGFYNAELDRLRQTFPSEYGERMNQIFGQLPSVFHYSWVDIPRKVRSFKSFWNKCWSRLYNDPAPVDRFPDVSTEEDVLRKAEELRKRGGEGQAPTFSLARTNPASMEDWLKGKHDTGGHLHHDEGQAGAPGEITQVAS